MSAEHAEATTNDGDVKITLGVLNAISGNSAVTQRSVARDLGIALGLTNAYLKRCIKKGYVKVQQIPRKRYAYYLTPRGFAEKSRLTAEYLRSSLDFFRKARSQLNDILATCVARGWRRVALAGRGDLAEISLLCARDHDLEFVGVFDPGCGEPRWAGLRVAQKLADLGDIDAIVIVDVAAAQAVRDALPAASTTASILAPPLLGVLGESREP